MLIENMEKQVTSTPPSGVGAELKNDKAISVNYKDMTIKTESTRYRAKAIILATGSVMQKLGISREKDFIGKGVSYYAKRDLEKFAGKRVLVVGGGNSTAKSALLAKTIAADVTLIHRRESLRTYPTMTKRLYAEGVNIIYNTEAKEIKGDDYVKTVVVEDNKTEEKRELAVDWIVICVGTEPNNKLAKEAGLAMEGQYVIVNEEMMTSRPGIFACGEITGCERHLITAASEGALAGMAVSEYLALEQVKSGQLFEGAKNGKYADEYLEMLQSGR